MPTHIRGRQILPGRADNSKAEVGYHPAQTVTQWSILKVSGRTGAALLMDLASADVATNASGHLFIAVHDADSILDRVTDAVARCSPGPVLVGPVDTSASSGVGADVFLSDTLGEVAFTAGTVTRRVGHVVVDGTEGYWMFTGALAS